jgi:Fe-S oxidoreductase
LERFDYGAFFGPIAPLADALRESPERFWEPTREQLAQPHEYVLYLGCNVLRTMHLAESLVAVLKAMKVDFIALGGSAHCCGVIHQMVGDTAAGLRIGQKTLDTFGQCRPKVVLTYCPGCNTVFDGKLASGELHCDLPYQHITQFIAEHLDQLPSKKPIRRRVALHAHQSTARVQSDSAHVLAILRAIPALDVIELPAGEEWGNICTPAIMKNIGAERDHAVVAAMFDAAKSAGCDAVVSVHHTCYRELLRAEKDFDLEWLNYIELLAASLALGPFPPRYKQLFLAGDPEAAFVTLAPRAGERGVNLDGLRRAVDVHFRPGASSASIKRP